MTRINPYQSKDKGYHYIYYLWFGLELGKDTKDYFNTQSRRWNEKTKGQYV